ncbi:hypothetical protein I4U23_020362 [Adineta vaga]|nr:hypothetical protein I4U23_020362 [Adineta vaga]
MNEEDIIEKFGMIEDPNQSVTLRLSPEQLKIHRIRKILLILIGFLLTFDTIYLIFIVHAYVDKSRFSSYFKSNYELVWTLLSVIYDAFGFIVTIRYFQKALRVFASIGTVLLILVGTSFIVLCIAAFNTTHQNSSRTDDDDLVGPTIYMLIFTISSIILMIVICLSFKLSNLLVHNQRTIIRTV